MDGKDAVRNENQLVVQLESLLNYSQLDWISIDYYD